jgi:hypothetical protein
LGKEAKKSEKGRKDGHVNEGKFAFNIDVLFAL